MTLDVWAPVATETAATICVTIQREDFDRASGSFASGSQSSDYDVAYDSECLSLGTSSEGEVEDGSCMSQHRNERMVSGDE